MSSRFLVFLSEAGESVSTMESQHEHRTSNDRDMMPSSEVRAPLPGMHLPRYSTESIFIHLAHLAPSSYLLGMMITPRVD